MTTDDYLDQVLAHLPRTTPHRPQIALELRGHIEERLATGQPLDDVLRQLGDPAVLAESYLAGLSLVPADFGPRVLAKVVDALAFLLLVAVTLVLAWLSPRGGMTVILICVAVLIAGFGFLIYTIVAEWRSGQTFGKRRYGLFVVQESGAPITLGQSVVRQMSLVFQIFWIDALFALFTERRQRAFELLSKTRVVRVDDKQA
ncbi:RDD family protein [Luteitalea pratensis]|uniref:RDD family protein n=1 Tax=Luteitalea pratensis TaxID=1855912 RepID=A0A143PG40_LUTPR|nr:RDD family protein [Luteitalea pratensis]AMY07038.1 RDD family protein [Luteitalea pratensis]